jgi:hypothetical protein
MRWRRFFGAVSLAFVLFASSSIPFAHAADSDDRLTCFGSEQVKQLFQRMIAQENKFKVVPSPCLDEQAKEFFKILLLLGLATYLVALEGRKLFNFPDWRAGAHAFAKTFPSEPNQEEAIKNQKEFQTNKGECLPPLMISDQSDRTIPKTYTEYLLSTYHADYLDKIAEKTKLS